MKSLELHHAIEAVLTEHQAFGSSDYIHEQLHVCYKRRLGKIAAYLPVAGRLLNALNRSLPDRQYHVIGDTVVRCAIQHGLKQLETGTRYGLPLDECEEVFHATIDHIEQDKAGSPLETGVTETHRLGPQPYHGWVWSEERSDDVFGRSFRYLVADNYGEALCTPDADELALLAKAARLLGDLLPKLSRSALSHAHLIAVFPMVGSWKGKASSSQFRLAGTIFLSRELLQSPWCTAEHLFHECLHQKLYDFRHGHSLLGPGYWRDDAPKVCSIWNRPDSSKSNYWDAHRAVAAFHVYVHLSLLSAIAEEREQELEGAYGPLRGSLTMIESQRARERAHYLGEQIKGVCWKELGLAGKRLINWLISVLDAFDPNPPRFGSYIHLLLDLYDRDTKRVEAVLSANDLAIPRSNLFGELKNLISHEVNSTRWLLSTLNAGRDLARFDSALAKHPDEELGTKFTEVRGLICKTLLDVPPDRYRLTSSLPGCTDPEESVERMVHASSQQLDAILCGIRHASEPLSLGQATP